MSADNGAFRQQIALMGLSKPDAYNPYAAGAKTYGPTGKNNPTNGPLGKAGYQKRDMMAQAKKNALLRRMKAEQSGEYLSTDYLMGEK